MGMTGWADKADSQGSGISGPTLLSRKLSWSYLNPPRPAAINVLHTVPSRVPLWINTISLTHPSLALCVFGRDMCVCTQASVNEWLAMLTALTVIRTTTVMFCGLLHGGYD